MPNWVRFIKSVSLWAKSAPEITDVTTNWIDRPHKKKWKKNWKKFFTFYAEESQQSFSHFLKKNEMDMGLLEVYSTTEAKILNI